MRIHEEKYADHRLLIAEGVAQRESGTCMHSTTKGRKKTKCGGSEDLWNRIPSFRSETPCTTSFGYFHPESSFSKPRMYVGEYCLH